MAVAMIFDYGLERIACAGGQRRFKRQPKLFAERFQITASLPLAVMKRELRRWLATLAPLALNRLTA